MPFKSEPQRRAVMSKLNPSGSYRRDSLFSNRATKIKKAVLKATPPNQKQVKELVRSAEKLAKTEAEKDRLKALEDFYKARRKIE